MFLIQLSQVLECAMRGEEKRKNQQLSLQIRKSKTIDSQEVWEMVNELAAYENEPNWNPYENFAEAFKDPKFACLVAEVGGKYVGFATYFRKYS